MVFYFFLNGCFSLFVFRQITLRFPVPSLSCLHSTAYVMHSGCPSFKTESYITVILMFAGDLSLVNCSLNWSKLRETFAFRTDLPCFLATHLVAPIGKRLKATGSHVHKKSDAFFDKINFCLGFSCLRSRLCAIVSL